MRSARIMIVEDEVIMAMSLKDLLEHWGFEVCPLVTSGEEAVEKAGSEKPELILMDISISGEVDGVEAVQKIFSFCKIPVVFMTGYVDDEIRERTNSLKPSCYLVKPLDLEELKETITSMLKDKAESPEISGNRP